MQDKAVKRNVRMAVPGMDIPIARPRELAQSLTTTGQGVGLVFVVEEEDTTLVGLTKGAVEERVGGWVEDTFVRFPPDGVVVEGVVDFTELVGLEGTLVLLPPDGVVEGVVDFTELVGTLVLLPPDGVVEGVVDFTELVGTLVLLPPDGVVEGVVDFTELVGLEGTFVLLPPDVVVDGVVDLTVVAGTGLDVLDVLEVGTLEVLEEEVDSRFEVGFIAIPVVLVWAGDELTEIVGVFVITLLVVVSGSVFVKTGDGILAETFIVVEIIEMDIETRVEEFAVCDSKTGSLATE